VYRGFAANPRLASELSGLWSNLAHEEQEHAKALETVRRRLGLDTGWRTQLTGWNEALDEIERCLVAAEALGSAADPDRQLAAGLEIELSEIDALRHALLAAAGQPGNSGPQERHAVRFAGAAARLTEDPQVRLRAALLRARARLEGHPA
jgi:hypothetical protein